MSQRASSQHERFGSNRGGVPHLHLARLVNFTTGGGEAESSQGLNTTLPTPMMSPLRVRVSCPVKPSHTFTSPGLSN